MACAWSAAASAIGPPRGGYVAHRTTRTTEMAVEEVWLARMSSAVNSTPLSLRGQTRDFSGPGHRTRPVSRPGFTGYSPFSQDRGSLRQKMKRPRSGTMSRRTATRR